MAIQDGTDADAPAGDTMLTSAPARRLPMPDELSVHIDEPRRIRWRPALIVMLCVFDIVSGGLIGFTFASASASNGSVLWLVAAVVLTWTAVVWMFGGDDPDVLADAAASTRPVVVAAAILTLPAAALALMTSQAWLLAAGAASVAASTLARLAAHRIVVRERTAGHFQHRVLVVGSELEVREFVALIDDDKSAALEVVGVCLVDTARSIPLIRRGLPVFWAEPGALEAAQAVRADTAVMIASEIVTPEFIGVQSRALHCAGVPVLLAGPIHRPSVDSGDVPLPVAAVTVSHVRGTVPGMQRFMKDMVDRACGAALLLLLSPVLLAIALAVRLTSDGEAFFRQPRVGLGGRTFTMYKFRSMHQGAEAGLAKLRDLNEVPGALLFKMKADPRVTKVGAWLRRSSLDELPQLINVVRGHMSLVGPRPALPSEVATYPELTWRRLLVKPGMTGLWQISGRSDLPSEEGVQLDLRYVDNWSLGLDVSILMKTLQVVRQGSGAY